MRGDRRKSGTIARAILYTGGAQAIRVLTQIASLVILSRLLSPADFGIAAMTMPMVAFVTIFQDLGLQQVIIQSRHLDQGQISSLIRTSRLVAVAIGLALILLAPASAWLLREPRLTAFTAAWALPVTAGALAAPYLASLRRDGRAVGLAIMDAVAALAGFAALLALAVVWRSYWAMWGGAAVTAIVTLAWAWIASDWKQGGEARTGIVDLIRFGTSMTATSFLGFLTRNLDVVIVGRVFGSAAVGYYARAYRLVLLPVQTLLIPIGQIVTPEFAVAQRHPAVLERRFAITLCLANVVLIPLLLTAAITSREFTSLLLGPGWMQSAPILIAIAIAGMLMPLETVATWLLIAKRRQETLLRWSLLANVGTFAAFLVGTPWGPSGIAFASTLAQWLCRAPLMLWMLQRTGAATISRLAALYLPFGVAAVCSLATASLLRHQAIGGAALVIGTATVATGTSFAGMLTHRTGRRILTAVLRWRSVSL